MATSLNGHQCCALDLPCCIPPPGVDPAKAQESTIAKVMQKRCPSLSDADAGELANEMLSHFDLVPKGVGKAIVAGYAPWMSKTPLA